MIAIHLRHHDIHQDNGDLEVRFDQRDRLAAGRGGKNFHAASFQHTAQREDVAGVVVHQQRGLTDQILVGTVEFLQMRCFSIGNSVITRCKNSDVSSSRRSGEFTPFTTMLRAIVCNSASSSTESSRPVNTMTGTLDNEFIFADAVEYFETAHVRQPQIEHDAVVWVLAQGGKRTRAGFGRDDLDIVVIQQFPDAHPFGRIVLDDQQAFAARPGVFHDLGQRSANPFGRGRLADIGKCAAGQSVLTVFVQCDDLNRDVPRQGVVLQLT